MNKNIIIAVLATALVTFVVLAVIGMSMEDEKQSIQKNDYSSGYSMEEARRDFVGSCMNGGGSEEFCDCGFTKLTNEYTLREIASMGIEGEYPPKFYETVRQCRDTGNAQLR